MDIDHILHGNSFVAENTLNIDTDSLILCFIVLFANVSTAITALTSDSGLSERT